ncbi:hypothetical protein [Silvimonas soli]|uniref:hypothetical protein n=2 Tax=Silvimonas TaxID=300264 RepID=UPI0024B367E1|nr:hypothetical protein [Silvimonas soli]
MSCLSERIVDAVFFMLSGYAFADGIVIESPREVTIANIVPPPVTIARANSEPGYLHRSELEYRVTQGKPFYVQAENFYNAQFAHDFPIAPAGKAAPSTAAGQQTPNYFHMGTSTAPQLMLAQSSNPTSPFGPQPQRRLSLIVSDWAFSGSARVTHNKGATLTVRHSF